MAEIECECLYCGKTWTDSSYYYLSGSKPHCPICKDRNVKVKAKDKSKKDVFGYERTKAAEDAYVKKEDDDDGDFL